MASIKCGNCGLTHGSADDVRSCYQGQTVQAITREDEQLTDRQLKFIATLRTERGLLTDGIGKLTKAEASAEIKKHLSQQGHQAKADYEEHIKGKNEYSQSEAEQEAAVYRWKMRRDDAMRYNPAMDGSAMAGADSDPEMTHEDWIERVRAQRAALRTEAAEAQARVYEPRQGDSKALHSSTWPKYENVPAGHYAVPSATGNNDLDFFRVDRPEDGPWKGRWFIKRVIGGKPDSKIRGKGALAAMKAISDAGPDKAAMRYGQEIGRCYKCNRHLTDEMSRALGIGPDCRSRLS